jgi:hypothetical protein
MNNEWKMDKICQYGWKTVEMDENMIDECINPQYWWTYNICCIWCSILTMDTLIMVKLTMDILLLPLLYQELIFLTTYCSKLFNNVIMYVNFYLY